MDAGAGAGANVDADADADAGPMGDRWWYGGLVGGNKAEVGNAGGRRDDRSSSGVGVLSTSIYVVQW